MLKSGSVSSNVFLRKLHNFCLNMNWLPWPILPKAQWPPIRFKSKRAITAQEHQAIITRERNPERRAFYQLCWHLGGSQSDIASLHAEDVDWREHTIAYAKNAHVKLPPLEEYERLQAEEKVIAVEFKKVLRTPRTANLPVK